MLDREGISTTLHSAPGHHQVIVGIDVIDRFGRDELVLDEHRGRHRAAVEDVERDRDNLGAVFLRESRRPIRSAACPAARSSARPSGEAF